MSACTPTPLEPSTLLQKQPDYEAGCISRIRCVSAGEAREFADYLHSWTSPCLESWYKLSNVECLACRNHQRPAKSAKSIVSAVSMASYPHGRHSAENPTRNPLRRRAFYRDLKHLLDRYWSRLVTHGPLGERHGKKQNREACCLRPIRGR